METPATVYSKPSCVQCNATYRALESAGIAYSAVDVSTNDDALAYIKSLGYTQAPVVVTGADHWAGFRPDEIANIV